MREDSTHAHLYRRAAPTLIVASHSVAALHSQTIPPPISKPGRETATPVELH
jgi:hypothetical protein